MNLELAGKTALITGSSHGIGRSIAEVMYGDGCQIAINGRNENNLKLMVQQLSGAIPVIGDVTQPDQASRVVAEALEKLGRLDILICNVGGGQSVEPGKETFAEWQRVFALNLWSTTNTVEAATASLATSQGAIVCVSSICGLEVVPGAPVTYSAAKAALNAYVRGVARPLGKRGIRINAVAPGNIVYPDSPWEHRLRTDPSAVREMLHREVALDRFGSAQDVAHLVAFLASPRASFSTGAVWTLDGGQTRS